LGPNADLEDVAYVMKEKSSLTLGDIKSVITNFRPSTTIRPDVTTTRTGEKLTSNSSKRKRFLFSPT